MLIVTSTVPVKGGVSTVLIAKDEAAVIGRCLESLRGLDQVVVLDTGSSDGTPDIARSLGADVRLWEPPEPFHFALARNEALRDAKHTWVLSVDADEVLADGSVWAVRGAARGAEWGRTVRYLDRDPHHPTVVVERLAMRLFRKDKFHWKNRFHERPVAAARVGPVTPAIGVLIEHRPEPKPGRRERNLKLLLLAVEESPEETRLMRHLAQELMTGGDWGGAAGWLRKYIPAVRGRDRDEECLSEMCLGRCLFALEDVEGAVRAYARAHMARPDHRDAFFQGAAQLMARRRIPAAADWLRRCLSLPSCRGPSIFCFNLAGRWDTIVKAELAKCEAAIEAAERAAGPGQP